jgi:hypothetical protein
MARLARPLGRVTSLELLDRDSFRDRVRRRYRARFERGTLLFTVTTNGPGLLESLDLAEPLR